MISLMEDISQGRALRPCMMNFHACIISDICHDLMIGILLTILFFLRGQPSDHPSHNIYLCSEILSSLHLIKILPNCIQLYLARGGLTIPFIILCHRDGSSKFIYFLLEGSAYFFIDSIMNAYFYNFVSTPKAFIYYIIYFVSAKTKIGYE